MPPASPLAHDPNLLEQLLNQLAERIASQLATHTPPATTADQRSPWMSCHNAADYLDWPKQRLYKLSAQGAIPHYNDPPWVCWRLG